MEQAVGSQPVTHRVGEAGQFDAVRAHDADAAKLKPFGEIEDGPAIHQRGEGVIGRQVRWAGFKRAGRPMPARPCGRRCARRHRSEADRPASNSFGRRFQIGSRRPATMWISLSVNSGTSASSACPGAGEGFAVGFPPMASAASSPAAWRDAPSAGSAARGVRPRRRRASGSAPGPARRRGRTGC